MALSKWPSIQTWLIQWCTICHFPSRIWISKYYWTRSINSQFLSLTPGTCHKNCYSVTRLKILCSKKENIVFAKKREKNCNKRVIRCHKLCHLIIGTFSYSNNSVRPPSLKFRYSEKATNILPISHLYFDSTK